MVPPVPPPSIPFLQLHLLLEPHPAHRESGIWTLVISKPCWEEVGAGSGEDVLHLVQHQAGVTVRLLVMHSTTVTIGSGSTLSSYSLPLSYVEHPGAPHHHHLQPPLHAGEGHVLQGPVPVIIIILQHRTILATLCTAVPGRTALSTSWSSPTGSWWRPSPCCAWRRSTAPPLPRVQDTCI